MTTVAATLGPASRAPGKPSSDRTLLLMLPALAVLVFMFVVPLTNTESTPTGMLIDAAEATTGGVSMIVAAMLSAMRIAPVTPAS